MSGIEERYHRILARIDQARSGAPAREIVLLAVSKGQPAEAIEALYRLGHRDFGENYVQELLEKPAELERRGCAAIRWHFIGHLQTNKVKALIDRVAFIHAVDSERLARELAKRWKASGRKGWLPVFIEVNIDDEPSKSGVVPDGAPFLAQTIVEELGDALSLQGLMCIPSPDADGGTRPAFARLRELERRCTPWSQGKLSMGMSDDFEDAILEGATHVRVGTAIFGPRTGK